MSFLSTCYPAGSSRRKYSICATCLSVGLDDQLHPFSEELTTMLKHLLYDFDLDVCLNLVPPENGLKLCDLCLKTLQDISFFKQKALKSLDHLKKQWEHWLKQNQMEKDRSQSLAEDVIVVTTKVEIKEEPDPLETPKLSVFSHSTPETNVLESETVDIKEESHIDSDNDQTNAENNSDTESADSEDMVDEIKKSSLPKTVRFATDVKRANSGSKNGYSSAIAVKANSSKMSGNKRKIFIKKNIKSNRIQNAARPLVRTALKPDSSFRVTSDSSYMPVKIEKSSLKVEPSTLQKTKSQAKVRRNTAAKDQSDTQTARNRPRSDTDPNSGAEERNSKQNIPWYLTVLTREQLVKIREDLLKDPSFAKARHKCRYCGQTFKTKDNWNHHKELCCDRSKENAEFSCFVCRLRFDTLALLSSHMRFHSLGHHTYQCSTCDYTTMDMYFVVRHRCPNKGGEKVPPKDPTMKLAIGRRQYYCPACDYVNHTEVKSHYLRYHTSTGPVKCDVCHKNYKNLASVLSHKIKIHSGKPPPEKKEVIFCAPCVKSFYTISSYRAHMKTVKHAPKDQVNISCDECPKKFHLQKLYEKHKRSHELIRSGTKPHKCPHCGLSYVFKSTLGTHIRTKHTKREIKRDHVCEVCGAAFKTSTTLHSHIAKHSDERPYKCEYCGDTFKYSGARYTHIKLKHKKKKTKPDDENKGTRKSARNRKWRMEKIDEHEQRMGTEEHIKITETHEHEQSMESHEEEQSMETSVSKGDVGSEDYDKNLEMQSIAESMEVRLAFNPTAL